MIKQAKKKKKKAELDDDFKKKAYKWESFQDYQNGYS